MRAGCCTKITIRSRMETVSVPSESTLRYAVGDFKPQLIVARKSLPPPSGEVRPAHVFFFTVCPLRAGRSVGEAAAAAGPARGLARRRRRPPQLTRKNLPGGSRRHRCPTSSPRAGYQLAPQIPRFRMEEATPVTGTERQDGGGMGCPACL